MSNLDKKIENYIFGNIPTSELLDKAYDIKVQNFGKTKLTVLKFLSL